MRESVCSICRTNKDVEFTVSSKHLTVHCERFFKELDVKDVTTNHITQHLCIDCFNKIFNLTVNGS